MFPLSFFTIKTVKDNQLKLQTETNSSVQTTPDNPPLPADISDKSTIDNDFDNQTNSKNSNATNVTVNGQSIDVPDNGQLHKVINDQSGSTTIDVNSETSSNNSTSTINVNSSSSSSGSNVTSKSSLNIQNSNSSP
jgi:hypothetical protein